MPNENVITLRPATPADASLLHHWDELPHVVDADPNNDWKWETELTRTLLGGSS